MVGYEIVRLLEPGVLQVLDVLDSELREARSIHRFRIACRRLRAAIWVFRGRVGERRRRALDRRLAAMARPFGPVRDWDVLKESASTGADERIDARRSQALTDALAVLGGVGGSKLRHALGDLRERLARQAPISGREMQLTVDGAMHRSIRVLERRIDAVSFRDPRTIHRVRLGSKRLRYAIELLEPWLVPRQIRCSALDRLRVAQDRIGHWNDARQRDALLASLDLDPATPSSADADTETIRTVLRDLARLQLPRARRARGGTVRTWLE